MTDSAFTRERLLFSAPYANDPTTQYWRRDDDVYYHGDRLIGADANTFRFYLGAFAKDARHCYCTSSRLRGANASTFRALNYCYATDGARVWTIGGLVSEADAESFVALDDGAEPISRGWSSCGYGRDRAHVYYQDRFGRPCLVRKATADTFTTPGDRTFGRDHQYVFLGRTTIPGARVSSWRPLGGYYSTDGKRVFYGGKRLPTANPLTFRVVSIDVAQLATDGKSYFWGDEVVNENTYARVLREDTADHGRA